VLLTGSTFVFIFLPVFIVLHVAVTGATTPDWMRGNVPLKGLNRFLLVASIAYFALLDLQLAVVLVAATAFTYGVAWCMARTVQRKAWLSVGIVGLVALLLAARWFNARGTNVGTLALPITSQSPDTTGLLAIVLSFFVLQAIGYLVEAYRRTITDLDPVRRSLALLFFPCLLAGPIVKRAEMEEQITRRMVSVANFAYGVRRFAIGLFKKVALADILGQIADTIFALPPSQVAAARAWLGIGCFALQAYFAISAYSDMALGLGRMCGFRLSENFKWPYVARSMHEFWEEWFVTLGQWLRDYARLPLGAGPLGPTLVAFLVAGLWYGTRWTFVVWALFHAAFVAAERVGLARLLGRTPGPIRHAYVVTVMLVGFVFFRSDSLPAAVTYLNAMAGRSQAIASAYYLNRFLAPEVWLALISAIIGAAPLVRAIGRWRVAIDGATTAIAVMAFAVLFYIWRMGIRLVTWQPRPHRPPG
jgi:alginate O-acetyltransferase complex protein AlgI